MVTPRVAAAIIAGGEARRLGGRDKSRLLVEGRPIIVRQVDVLQRVASEVFIVAPDPSRFADLGLPVRPDVVPGLGTLGGIHTALETTDADLVLVVACDLPFLHEGVLARLTTLAAGHDGAWVRTPRGAEPLLACYTRRALGPIRDRIAARALKAADLGGVLRMAELGPDELGVFGPIDRLLTNINTPEDYARVQ